MDAKDKLKLGLSKAAEVGITSGCTEYVINVNRGEGEVHVSPETHRVLHVALDLYSHLVNTKNPLIRKTLNVKPENIKKVYFHAMQGGVGTLVIGVLTDKNPEDIEIEHVK